MFWALSSISKLGVPADPHAISEEERKQVSSFKKVRGTLAHFVPVSYEKRRASMMMLERHTACAYDVCANPKSTVQTSSILTLSSK